MTRGLVLGKFMPPHLGHLHLIETAQGLCDGLSVVVGTQPSEALPGALRLGWMQALCPGARVLHLHREMPQLPEQHPQFWELWTQALIQVLGHAPDRVFAGEPYGAELAARLGAEFVFIPRTEGLSVSGTAARAEPGAHWALLPAPVRAHYCRRVRIVGPESAGKTTLAKTLSRCLDASYVAEFARGYLSMGGRVDAQGMWLIAQGQAASEDALARYGRPWLICDTDPLLTCVWSDALLGTVEPKLARHGRGRSYGLTLLVAPTPDWQPDALRFHPELAQRERFFERCRDYFPDAVVLQGSWQQREAQALRAVQETL